METLDWKYDARLDLWDAQGFGWRLYTVALVGPARAVVTCDSVQGEPRDHWRITEGLCDSLDIARTLAQRWDDAALADHAANRIRQG